MRAVARVLINARAAVRPELGGVERWARELARGCRRSRPSATRSCVRRARSPTAPGHAWEQAVLPAVALARRAPLSSNPANIAPVALRRNVVVVHDAAALREPSWYSGAYAAWQRAVLPVVVRRARHVVTVSEFSRAELVELLGGRSGRA